MIMRRVDGGRLKINENGEMYIERRGRKPGPKVRKSSVGGSTAAQTPSSTPFHSGRRLSIRARRGEQNTVAGQVASIMRKYSNRRSEIFKGNCPSKTPSARVALRTADAVWHESTHFKVGDIVSVVDRSDRLPYFAQLRSFLTDPFAKHYASLTWLIPKRSAPSPHSFSAEHFAHGVIDPRNYPVESLNWLQSRPPLAAYQTEWTVARAAASRSRQRIADRARQLRLLAEEELARLGQQPIIKLLPDSDVIPK